MAEVGLEPGGEGSFELEYKARGIPFVNLIGRLPGTRPGLSPVLLAAHYDTCGAQPGADDNAAAVAILLELVGRLRQAQLDRDALFAFFDAEEPPHSFSERMGSVHYYRRQRREEIHCAVVLDLMGHDVPLPGLEDLVFIMGMESEAGLEGAVSACPDVPGVRIIPTLNRYVGDLSDHHVFRLHRRPYLFLSCGRWRHYHMPTDTPDKLNFAKMEAAASYLAELVPRVAASRLEGPFEGYDSTPAELRSLRRHLGPLVRSLGGKLEDRADIDQVALQLRRLLVD
jgi:Iap family predicted aminopeptidase